MVQILDQVGQNPKRFRPRTEQEFFALQLAWRLGDISSINDLRVTIEHVSRDTILNAYRRAMKSHPSAAQIRERFQEELKRSNLNLQL